MNGMNGQDQSHRTFAISSSLNLELYLNISSFGDYCTHFRDPESSLSINRIASKYIRNLSYTPSIEHLSNHETTIIVSAEEIVSSESHFRHITRFCFHNVFSIISRLFCRKAK